MIESGRYTQGVKKLPQGGLCVSVRARSLRHGGHDVKWQDHGDDAGCY
jgi:hypothetical protein